MNEASWSVEGEKSKYQNGEWINHLSRSSARWVHQLAAVPNRVINYPWLRDGMSAMAADSSPERSIAHGERKQHGLNETTKTRLPLYPCSKFCLLMYHHSKTNQQGVDHAIGPLSAGSFRTGQKKGAWQDGEEGPIMASHAKLCHVPFQVS